ncbi:MAG: hypothetical protein QOC66_2547 [Pseudonocardiales bacterium]|jgi:hypothetical protein|nr:hypothetical protein [Pseudonocardiales bacterium]
MTTPESKDPAPPTRRRWARFDLSATQLIATALAAITATIAASYLGVSGTVIGAAVASVVSAVGNAVYGHSLRSTRERVRVRTVTGPPRVAPHASPDPVRVVTPRTKNVWRRIAIGSIASFVVVLAVVTGVEVVAGRPLSDLVRGDGGTGTSVFGDTGSQGTTTPAPTPTVTRTVTPSVVVTTPTVTQTAPAVTKTATPTQTTTAPPATTTAASPSGTATSSPTTAP